MDNLVGPLTIRTGGEANGEDREDVEDVVVLVEDAEVETVVEIEEEAGVVLDRMIPLRATDVGCVATWPVTAPSLLSHREVAWLALPEESFLNPGKRAQGRGRGRQVRFGGLNVLYDEDRNSYPVDDAGQLYIPLELALDAGDAEIEAEKQKEIKN